MAIPMTKTDDQFDPGYMASLTGKAPRRPQLVKSVAGDAQAFEDRFNATVDQVFEAERSLDRDAGSFKPPPWDTLATDFIGPIAPGKLWYFVMASNNGKTLFIRSLVDRLISMGDRCYVVSTETKPSDFRLALACNLLGLYPGDLMSGAFQSLPNADQIRQDIKACIREIARGDANSGHDLLQFPKDGGALDPEYLWTCAHSAAEQRAEWFIVDHVDYLSSMHGAPEIQVSNLVNHALDQIRREFPFRVIATSQMNQTPFKTMGRMAMVTAPVEDWVKFGAVKKEIADGMVGAYRPLNYPMPDEETMKGYKAGVVALEDVVLPNAMRFKLMKHRDYGQRVGRHVTLEVHKGHLREFAERDIGGANHGIKTTRDFK